MRIPALLVVGVLALTCAGNARAEPSSLDVTRVGVGLAYLTAAGRVGNSSDSPSDVLHGGAFVLSVRVPSLDAWVAGSLFAGVLDMSAGSHTSSLWGGFELQVGQDVSDDRGRALTLSRGGRFDTVGGSGSLHVTLALVIGLR